MASPIARRLHRAIGVAMLLPLLGWAITGAIFYLKPGYAAAYHMVSIRTYPLAEGAASVPPGAWHEARLLRTILGDHLLVRTADGWQHLDPRSGLARPTPAPDDVERLLSDAIAGHPRYGRVASVDGLRAQTDTGIRLALDWQRLAVAQRGADTDRIDWWYRVHYLQWTGVPVVDRVLGVIGLVLLVTLSGVGARLWWSTRRS
jgi:hypothetical protein